MSKFVVWQISRFNTFTRFGRRKILGRLPLSKDDKIKVVATRLTLQGGVGNHWNVQETDGNWICKNLLISKRRTLNWLWMDVTGCLDNLSFAQKKIQDWSSCRFFNLLVWSQEDVVFFYFLPFSFNICCSFLPFILNDTSNSVNVVLQI